MLPNSQSCAPGQCLNGLQILPQFVGAVMKGNVAPAQLAEKVSLRQASDFGRLAQSSFLCHEQANRQVQRRPFQAPTLVPDGLCALPLLRGY